MKNWHNTLNDALQARTDLCEILPLDFIALWPLGTNISYAETVSVIVESNDMLRLISVTRDNRGFYETALSYITQTYID